MELRPPLPVVAACMGECLLCKAAFETAYDRIIGVFAVGCVLPCIEETGIPLDNYN